MQCLGWGMKPLCQSLSCEAATNPPLHIRQEIILSQTWNLLGAVWGGSKYQPMPDLALDNPRSRMVESSYRQSGLETLSYSGLGPTIGRVLPQFGANPHL